MKKDKNNIEFVVFNCFIRAIKSDGKYMLFRRSVNNKGIMKYLIKNPARNSDNPFYASSSIEDVVKTLEKITNDMAKSNGKKGGIKDLDKYEHVTMTINHLLHFFMEANGVAMDKLCSLGEEIYGLSCNKLFGDTIEDLERQEEQEIKNIADGGQLKAKLFQDFIKGLQDGSIPNNMSFDDFFNANAERVMQKIPKKRRNDEAFGQVLGRQPDDNEFMRMVRGHNDDYDELPDWDRV